MAAAFLIRSLAATGAFPTFLDEHVCKKGRDNQSRARLTEASPRRSLC